MFLSGSILFLFFFVVKCLHFKRCDYTSDIFTHFQLSHDWLLGKPLFYENSFGFHSKFHNYFIDLCMAPFTYLFSVYGLFIALFGFVIGALYAVLKMLENQGVSFQTKLLFVIFYASPLTYFTLHNEHYGFHVEMLLIPLCLLFTASFIQQNKWFWLWAFFIVLVKEDAIAVLWCCISMVYLGQWNQKTEKPQWLLRNFVRSTLLCVLIFIAGFVWLKYQNNWGATRSSMLFETLRSQSIKPILTSLQYLTLLRIQLTLFVMFIIFLYAGWRFTLGAVLLSAPLLILNFLAGILYSLDGALMIKNFFSLLWAPRLSMYWGYWLSALTVALIRQPQVKIHPKLMRTLSCVLFGIVLFKFQLYFFLNTYVTRFDIKENIKEVFGINVEFELNPEFKDAEAIAKELPSNYPVAPMYRVFGAFHHQDIIWLNALQNAYIPPRMILASYNQDEVPEVTKIMKHPVYLLYRDKLHIYTEIEDTIYVMNAKISGQWIHLKK